MIAERLEPCIDQALLEHVPRAWLAYAEQLSAQAGKEWLTRFLRRPDWAEHLYAWLSSAKRLLAASQELPTLRQELLDSLHQRLSESNDAGIQRALHDGLRLFGDLAAFDGAREPILRWVAHRAGPDSAGLLADLLVAIRHRDDHEEAEVAFALIDRLLECGSSELRRGERFSLMVWIVARVDADRPGRRELALQLLLRNEHPAPNAVERDVVLRAAERALADGGRHTVATDLAAMFGLRETTCHALAQASLPLVSEALIGALAAGETVGAPRTPREPKAASLGSTAAESQKPFRAAIRSQVRPPHFSCRIALHSAMRALDWVAAEAGADAERLDRWAEHLTLAFFRLHGVINGGADQGPLEPLTGWPQLQRGVLRALLTTLADDRSPELTPARHLLEAHANDLKVARAVVATLPQEAATRGPSLVLDGLKEDLGFLLAHQWREPVGGVDFGKRVEGAKRVEFVSLENELRCEVVGDALRIDRNGVGEAVGDQTGERARAVAALYAAHELVHVAQGIGDKEVVTRLRAAGGETTLLHLDLTADHVAALIVGRARPSWSLTWLKSLHCETAARFPASRQHLAASRTRKALRQVSLRVDWLLREHQLLSLDRLGGGYAFADFGPAGGEFLLLSSGPPWTVLGGAPLTQESARHLSGHAGDDASSELDQHLLSLCRKALSS